MAEKSKIKVAVLGATGTVGRRMVAGLARHPWLELAAAAASPASAGKTYGAAVQGSWPGPALPAAVAELVVARAAEDVAEISRGVELVFSAMSLGAEETRALEEVYAGAGVAVVSTSSAHRATADVPVIMPEINPGHAALIDIQRKNRGWSRGLIAVKPNCSVQSYLPVVKALERFGPRRVVVTTLQAVSGAGRTLESWPEMHDNVIPFIPGEEEKSEREPLKILGKLEGGRLRPARLPTFSATCFRVPLSDGHLAAIYVELAEAASRADVVAALNDYPNPIAALGLPSAPARLIHVCEQDDRPQPRLDRDAEDGMAVSVGRIREDGARGWKFVALSHNTRRGAAGGAILLAELLRAKGYVG